MRKVLAFAVVALMVAPVMASFSDNFETETVGTWNNIFPLTSPPTMSYPTAYATVAGSNGWGFGQAISGSTSQIAQRTNIVGTAQISAETVALMTGNHLKLVGNPTTATTPSPTGTGQSTWIRQITNPGVDANSAKISFLLQMQNNSNTAGNEFFFGVDTNTWSGYAAIKAGAAATGVGQVEVGGSGGAAKKTVNLVDLGMAWDYTHTYLVEAQFVKSTGVGTLWLDGVMVAQLTGATFNINTVQMRSQKTVSFVDDLNVTPEPATMSVLGLGVLGLLRRRSA
jgi:hypothetical protein